MEPKTTPTVLVFYLDRELMADADVFLPYTEFINQIIAEKSDNMIAFFIPTDDNERIECINPVMHTYEDMDKLEKIIEDIKKNFQLGEDVADEFVNKDE